MLLVKKYGGSSVATPEKILAIAKKLKALRDQGHQLIVVVSAMGDTTDDLVQLSRKITLIPIQREIDMLLSSGERISMALMAMALNSLGCEAVSFTGSQSGVFTDGNHNNARVVDIRAIRVQEELNKNRVVVIAGFQGVDPHSKEVTTLGRGGSDTTAVALAAAFNADRCDILTDVCGLYTVDPRVSEVTPHPLPQLDYHLTLEMAYWGARVLHYRAVELAWRTAVPLTVHISHEEGDGSMISDMEQTHVTAVNYNHHLAVLRFPDPTSLSHALEAMNQGLKSSGVPFPQVIYQRQNQNGIELFLSAPPETFESLTIAIQQWCKTHKRPQPECLRGLGTVTITGRGLIHSGIVFDLSKALTAESIQPEALITTPLSLTFVLPQDQLQKAVQKIHREFVEKPSANPLEKAR